MGRVETQRYIECASMTPVCKDARKCVRRLGKECNRQGGRRIPKIAVGPAELLYGRD